MYVFEKALHTEAKYEVQHLIRERVDQASNKLVLKTGN